MITPPIPADEDERLAELTSLEILYTPPEEVFDRVTADLARIFEVPAATMSLIDKDVEFYKSGHGVPAELLATRVVPRELSICAYIVGVNEMLVVEDVSTDERFADNPILTASNVKFYAGAPLRTETGRAIGSLCIVDQRPRRISTREGQLLQMIADGVMTEVRLRSTSNKVSAISRQLADRNRAMERDLKHARTAQRFMLPPSFLHSPPFEISHLYRPFDHIGGDFLDIRQREDSSVALFLADVSGHGAGAALTAAMLKTSFQRAAQFAIHPSQIMSVINRDLRDSHLPGTFITAIAAMLNPTEKTAVFASAGHPNPLWVRDGQVTPITIENELPLLIDPDLDYQNNLKLNLSPGDRILTYTDGVVEARSGQHHFLGIDGLSQQAADAASHNGRDYLESIFTNLCKFTGGHFQDDVALLMASLTG